LSASTSVFPVPTAFTVQKLTRQETCHMGMEENVVATGGKRYQQSATPVSKGNNPTHSSGLFNPLKTGQE
jgi:hypothetical protein